MSVYEVHKLKKHVNDMDKCTEIIIHIHTRMVVAAHVHTMPIYHVHPIPIYQAVQGCIQRG